MKIAVIYEKCIGCGECYAACSELFTLDDAGIAQIKTTLPVLSADVLTRLDRATKICPTKAIVVEQI